MEEAIHVKYSLQAYYYTQLHRIADGSETAIFKPVFFEFPWRDPYFGAGQYVQ